MKAETVKIRFVKVHTPKRLGRQTKPAYVSAKYSSIEEAEASPEPGKILKPLMAYNYMKKRNKRFSK